MGGSNNRQAYCGPCLKELVAWGILFLSLLGTMLSLLILWWSPDSHWSIWCLGVILFGFTLAPIFPMTFAFGDNRLKLSGKLVGWLFAGAAVGGMFLPWLITQLFEPFGPGSMIMVLIINMAVALIVLFILLWQTSSRDSHK